MTDIITKIINFIGFDFENIIRILLIIYLWGSVFVQQFFVVNVYSEILPLRKLGVHVLFNLFWTRVVSCILLTLDNGSAWIKWMPVISMSLTAIFSIFILVFIFIDMFISSSIQSALSGLGFGIFRSFFFETLKYASTEIYVAHGLFFILTTIDIFVFVFLVLRAYIYDFLSKIVRKKQY